MKTAKPVRHLPESKRHWPLFLFLTITAIALLPLLPHPYSEAEVLVGAVGGIWALAFYHQSQHAENARFFMDLLKAFNERYDGMNDRLQDAIRTPNAFTNVQNDMFIDYFNLCAEEWLFWKDGYVYDAVWNAWANGMRQYARDSRVQKLWREERESNSYYGFELPC
jgi:hypothetical protein